VLILIHYLTDGGVISHHVIHIVTGMVASPAVPLGLKKVGINPVPFRPDFYILPVHFRIFGPI